MRTLSLHSTFSFFATSLATFEIFVEVYNMALTPVTLIGPPNIDSWLTSPRVPRRNAYSSAEPNNWKMCFSWIVLSCDQYLHWMTRNSEPRRAMTSRPKQAASDPALRKLLADGVGRLDSARGIAWVQLSNGARNAVLKSVEGSEFFTTLRTATINNLYANPLVYRFFGFEGSSVEHGGYIHRGFDDIGWLPNSSSEDRI
jgi:hypothetical protein